MKRLPHLLTFVCVMTTIANILILAKLTSWNRETHQPLIFRHRPERPSDRLETATPDASKAPDATPVEQLPTNEPKPPAPPRIPERRDSEVQTLLESRNRLQVFWTDLEALADIKELFGLERYIDAVVTRTAVFLNLDGSSSEIFCSTAQTVWRDIESSQRRFEVATLSAWEQYNKGQISNDELNRIIGPFSEIHQTEEEANIKRIRLLFISPMASSLPFLDADPIFYTWLSMTMGCATNEGAREKTPWKKR